VLSVNWKLDAQDDLAVILDYIDHYSPRAAENLKRDILKTVDALVLHPFLYRAGRVDGTREAVIHPNYIVIYQVGETLIEVLRVMHSRQEYPDKAYFDLKNTV
jgi:toxin ParE1/3/4